jgi:hypothetical protein
VRPSFPRTRTASVRISQLSHTETMGPSVRVVHDQVLAIDAFDATEAAHRPEVLGWLERTDDILPARQAGDTRAKSSPTPA